MSATDSRIALVALGSNLGNSAGLIERAFKRLDLLSSAPARHSSLWKSVPVDCPPGSPPFVNAASAIVPHPAETPESLLEKLLAIEKEFGRRTKQILNEPRPLDLDLIAFGQEQRDTPSLILPHPRAHLRRFVLLPLSEVAPAFRFPGTDGTVEELLAALPETGDVQRL
jgi:2-amino-4-hydroxy-6-hydroxymethyldihydropteridine diphosphokinase